jgi:hypothetical protein
MNEETSGQMLERLCDNAQAWAQEFRKTTIKLGYSDMDDSLQPHYRSVDV